MTGPGRRPVADPPPALEGGHLLLVEDTPADALLIQTLLTEHHPTVTVVAVARLSAAREALASRAFDVILLNLGLPDAAEDPGDDLPPLRRLAPDTAVVVVSGNADPARVVTMLHRGASDYLVKGAFDAATLSATLARAVRHVRGQRQAEHSRVILETTSDGVVVLDGRGLVVDVNDPFCALLDRRRAQLVGVPLATLLPAPNGLAARLAAMAPRSSDRFTLPLFRETDGGEEAPREVEVSAHNTPLDGGQVIAFVRDITDSRRRDQALRTSEQRLRDISEAAGEYIWELDTEGRFTFLSNKVKEVLGHAPEDLTGVRFLDPVEPEDVAWMQPWFDRQWRLGLPFRDIEFRSRTRGRRLIWQRVSGVPVFDTEGTLMGYRGAGQDVTRRRHDQERLRDSEHRLKAILDAAADAILGLDENGRIRGFNPAAERMFRCTAGEVLGEPLARLLPDPSARRFDEVLGAYLRAGEDRFDTLARTDDSGPLMGRRRDGTQFPIEMRLSDTHLNTPHLFIALVRDITERHRAEEALRQSEERYRSLVEMSPDAILVLEAGRIVYANRAAASLFAVPTAGDVVGQWLAPCLSGDGAAALLFVGAPDTERHGPVAGLTLQRHDGTTAEVEGAATRVPYQGREAVQTVLRDVTERRHVEEQLIQASKMATLGEMAAGMAHELSQPLNIIRMNAEAARVAPPRNAPPMPPWGADRMAIIEGQAQRMGLIVDHMRTFTRKQDGPGNPFDATAAAQRAVDLVRGQYALDGIALTLTPAPPVPVRGQPIQLEQVLLNLITNARDAIHQHRAGRPPGAEIRDLIAITLAAARNTVHLAVSDTGGGVPAAVRDRIFEPFFTTKEVGKGTGLGLSVSYNLIVGMGGRMWLDNTETGAVFHITLPTATGVALNETDTPARLELPAGSYRVLIVDDEEAAAHTLAEVLRQQHWTVAVCHNGESAFASFEDEPADLVVTDLRMPHGTGEGLIARLRALDPDLPILVMTGDRTEKADPPPPWWTAVDGVLTKPVSLRDLVARAGHLLQHGRDETQPS